MNYWLILVGAVAGSILTILVAVWCRFAGLLRIHQNDENERPYLFLELNDEPDKIIGKKYVVFRVKLDSRQ